MDAKKCNLIETLYTLYKTFISSLSKFLLQNGKGSSRGLRFFWGVREEGKGKPISVMKLICNIHMKKKGADLKEQEFCNLGRNSVHFDTVSVSPNFFRSHVAI